MFKKLIPTPKSIYTNYFDIGKYIMIWNVFWVLFTILGFLTAVNIYFSDPNIKTTAVGFIFMGLAILLLKRRREYHLVAKITGVVCSIILLENVYFVPNLDRFVDALWLIALSVYLVYTLNAKWGITILVFNIIALVIAVLYFPVHKGELYTMAPPIGKQIELSVNTAASTFILCYLMYKMTVFSKQSENKYIEANQKLQNQNQEKTVLIQEIHHRVKNNLQVISSMLRLQAHEIQDKNTVKHFNEAVNRVSSMALIHEKMYQNENLSDINLREYLESLIKEIIRSSSFQKPVSSNFKCENINLDIENLVPLALIFNELITNTFKHAFIDSENNEINIKISQKLNGLEINYSDNGKWKEADLSNHFGTTLIQTFTEQLDGELLRKTDNGTEYYFKFPNIL